MPTNEIPQPAISTNRPPTNTHNSQQTFLASYVYRFALTTRPGCRTTSPHPPATIRRTHSFPRLSYQLSFQRGSTRYPVNPRRSRLPPSRGIRHTDRGKPCGAGSKPSYSELTHGTTERARADLISLEHIHQSHTLTKRDNGCNLESSPNNRLQKLQLLPRISFLFISRTLVGGEFNFIPTS